MSSAQLGASSSSSGKSKPPPGGCVAPPPGGWRFAASAGRLRRRHPTAHHDDADEEEERPPAGRDHFDGGGGAVRNWRAMRRELLRIARTALDIVIVARETASTSSPSLNGSRTSLLRNVRGELRRVDREVAVGLVMLAHDDAGQIGRWCRARPASRSARRSRARAAESRSSRTRSRRRSSQPGRRCTP